MLSTLATFFDLVSENSVASEKSLDLSQFGIDLDQTFDQLLSPAGIVNQFALSIIIQVIFILGYVISGETFVTKFMENISSFISGFIFADLKTRFTTGPIFDLLQDFEIHLSPQVCVVKV